MAGATIEDLPPPPRGFRPAQAGGGESGGSQFESLASARLEDERRARLLRRAAAQADGVTKRHMAALATVLEEGVGAQDPPRTLASSTRYRYLRNRICGWVWWLIEQHPDWAVHHITLLPPNTWIAPEDLQQCKPADLMKRLRNDLDRVGAKDQAGFVFAGLDGEFDARRGGFHLHYHLIVVGPKIQAIKALRTKRKYRRISNENAPLMVVKKVKRNELPYRLTYALKSFWKHVPTIPTNEGMKRARATRIPNPHHALWLLWMDKHKIKDMTLFFGSKPSKSGLIITSIY